MTNETWKAIPGFEGHYEVSDMGRIKFLPQTITKRKGNQHGTGGQCLATTKEKITPGWLGKGKDAKRRFTTLTTPGEKRNRIYRVPRLVLLTFAGPCPEGMEACHNDGDSLNNVLTNLRWDTHQANVGDRETHGRTVRGAKQHRSKLKESDIPLIRARLAEGAGIREVAREFKVNNSSISGIKDGTCWKHVP